MSKKKAFTGNTMTLKDFHGGSIPSDLPLPSAPGVIVRPMDRSGYDRPTPWGNPMARPDHRPRPNSSPATRHFDDKTPFLGNAVHIGRNFDEDERKPLDGVSAPRKTVSDENFHVPPSRVEHKPESMSTGRVSGWTGLGLGSQASNGAVNSFAGRVVEQSYDVVNSPNSRGNSEQLVSRVYPNAWAARKEEVVGVTEPVQFECSGQSAVSKLAHASALEKVSSGRWQSKQSIQYQADVQVSKFSETNNGLHPKHQDDNAYTRVNVVGGRALSDATLARHMERGLNIEDSVQGGRKEELDSERTGASTFLEAKESKYKQDTDRVQSNLSDSRFVGSESLPVLHSDALERPKLKLLPRTRPLEHMEPHVYPCLSECGHGHLETVNGVHGNLNPTKPDLTGSDVWSHAVERPKLSLKPRSQPPEQLEDSIERGRNALFGGARPRELVLKERGIEDLVNSHDLGQHSDRGKHNVAKFEQAPEHANPIRQSERAEHISLDQRMGWKFERKDPWIDVDRVDTRKRNWRNENGRNNRGVERGQQQQQQQHERHSSPETWRKPVEQPKPLSTDVGVRYGKVASAVELAQAFSRSISDPKLDNRYSGQSGLTGRTQMPFSRLMGPTRRTQINGY